LAVLLVVLNFAYNLLVYNRHLIQMCEHVYEMKQKQDSTDIFYFSESSNWNAQPSDSIQASISDLTALFFPTLKVHAVNQSASHAGIYKYWLKQLDMHKKKPGALVVSMSLRTFNAMWINSKLETELQQSIVMIKPYPNIINRFCLALDLYDNRTVEQREELMKKDWREKEIKFPYEFKYKTLEKWDQAMANGSYLLPDGSWDFSKIDLACHNVKAFAFNIDEDNPRVRDYDEIAAYCSENKIPLFFNLMAENVEYADRLVGKDLVFLMRQNRDFIMNRYNKGNCKVIDNLESVKGYQFTDQKWTTEHYNYKGRMLIASHLASGLKEIFTNQYKKAY
jgi:hypothetical protein